MHPFHWRRRGNSECRPPQQRATIGGNATVTGEVSAAALLSTGHIRATGNNTTIGVSNDKFLTDRLGDRYLRLYSSFSGSTYADFAARDVFAERDLQAANNTWGAGPTNQAEQGWDSNTGIVFRNCPNGQYVCAIGLGHVPGDSQYWTGARFQFRCCGL